MAKKRTREVYRGQRFERLEVIKEIEPLNGRRRVLCKCDCGQETEVNLYKLFDGVIKSCGCLGRELASRPRAKDLTNQVFSRLTVRHRDGDKLYRGSVVWVCECQCGNIISVSARDLTSGNTKSCGCWSAEYAKSLQTYNEQHHTVDGAFIPLLKQKIQTNNVTGVKGVSIRKSKNGTIRYIASITIKNQRHYLGIFNTLEEAAEARNKAEEMYHKPYLEDEDETN